MMKKLEELNSCKSESWKNSTFCGT